MCTLINVKVQVAIDIATQLVGVDQPLINPVSVASFVVTVHINKEE